MLERDTKMKSKLAQRIATFPSERWLKKAAEWNPELSSRYRTNRAIGRPRKRWEDDVNEFFKQEYEENENPIESSNQTNKTWINIGKDRVKWTLLEEAYIMTVEERKGMKKKENNQSRPARYFDGVRLSDEETANITKKNEMTTTKTQQLRYSASHASTNHLKAATDPHSRTS